MNPLRLLSVCSHMRVLALEELLELRGLNAWPAVSVHIVPLKQEPDDRLEGKVIKCCFAS